VPLHVAVGIQATRSEAERASTRAALRRNTTPGFELVDLSRPGALGFNELLDREADVFVLLEAGALPAPRWLDLLLGALRRPGCGLAGPSTNRAWNEQACAPNATADMAGLARQAAALAARFGSSARSLEPLYSLGAFCYAVRREVASALGRADQAYGEGPCWEMDYNARAARAGFAGLWVGASYVYRQPLDAEGARRDQLLVDRNRRIYQDRLCGLRLTGARADDDYEPHCRGDACEYFAPADVLRGPQAPATRASRAAQRATVRVSDRCPLVSCLMVTRERTEFALHAIAHFRRQTYPARELIVVEDGAPGLAARLPPDPSVRLISTGLVRSIGAMREHGCELARGDVVMLWDDDDWHGPDRLAHQLGPIIDGRADVTGLTDLPWFELDAWRCWHLDRRLQERLLLRRTYAGTLAFRRSVWGRLARFPDRSLAEDAAFLRQALARGARFAPLDGRGHYLYVRHGANSWQVTPDRHGPASGWLPAAVPDLPPDDLAFLERLRSPAAAAPLVSCLMPTRNRRRWVSLAVELLQRQTWPAVELVVVDDGDDPVDDLVAAVAAVRYVRLRRRTVLGAKRNLAAEAATGHILAHWDDDDWYASNRIELQVRRLQQAGADLVGCASLPFFDPARRVGWRYTWPPSRRPWLAGTSLMYRRELWAANRFAEVAHGEDTRFVWRTPPGRIAACPEPFVVALVHPGNTVPKSGRGAYWSAEQMSAITILLGSYQERYEALLKR
jgi:glycosyltransferase involved in cell wall biosynthesis